MRIVEMEGNLFNAKEGYIVHQVNCQGVMGSGVAVQFKEKYSDVYKEYKQLCDKYDSRGKSELLGCAQVVILTDKIKGVNIFGQDKYGYGERHTDYAAVRKAFKSVGEYLENEGDNSDIHIPYKMGCDRGGGDWEVYLAIITEELKALNSNIYIVHYTGGIENTEKIRREEI